MDQNPEKTTSHFLRRCITIHLIGDASRLFSLDRAILDLIKTTLLGKKVPMYIFHRLPFYTQILLFTTAKKIQLINDFGFPAAAIQIRTE